MILTYCFHFSPRIACYICSQALSKQTQNNLYLFACFVRKNPHESFPFSVERIRSISLYNLKLYNFSRPCCFKIHEAGQCHYRIITLLKSDERNYARSNRLHWSSRRVASRRVAGVDGCSVVGVFIPCIQCDISR